MEHKIAYIHNNTTCTSLENVILLQSVPGERGALTVIMQNKTMALFPTVPDSGTIQLDMLTIQETNQPDAFTEQGERK